MDDATNPVPRPQKRTDIQQDIHGDKNLTVGEAGNVNISYGQDELRKPFFRYLCQAPQKPDYYVERPDALAQVKQYLLQPDRDCKTFVIAAICGLGGIGKSVLAAALCYEQDIRERFPDGILWVTLGQEPDILPLLSQWIQAVGDYDYKPASPDAAKVHLRTLLQEKEMLLVVDDVWEPDHGEYFRVGGAGCCELVTTREAIIRDAKRCEMNVMSPEQAMELLTNAMDRPLEDEERDQAEKLAKAVGYLPLALQLAAAQLEQDLATWEELLEDLTAEMVRLENFDLPGTQFAGSQASKQQNISLIASFNLSLKRLQREQLHQFIRLGILPEDVVVTEGVAAMLWGMRPRKARGLLNFFYNRALLLAGAKQQGKPGYRLHDIVRYLGKRLIQSPVEPKVPGELPGLELSLAQVHGELLDAYKRQTGRNQWHRLQDDGYIYGHLTWHLVEAGRVDEIHKLMAETDEDGRNGWYAACERLGRTANFVTDLGRAWQQAELLLEKRPRESMVLQWRYGVMRATLNNLAGNVPAELIARFVETGYWQPAQGLAYAQQTQEIGKRVEIIEELCPHLPSSLFSNLLEIVRQIGNEFNRAAALSALSKWLPESLFSEALEMMQQIADEFSRVVALSALSKHIPESFFFEALEITQQIKNEFNRAFSLSALSERLPESLFSKALEIAQRIKDDYSRASTLHVLSKHMPELLPEALEVTRQIKNKFRRADALYALSKHMPELLPEALEVTRQIADESKRVDALSALSERLPESLFFEALEVTRQIADESSRAFAMSALSERLPESLFSEALEVTRQIEDKSSRAFAMSALSERLPELFPEALEVTRQIADESSRADALSALSERLPELFPEALEVTRQIADESSRADALTALSKHMPEFLFSEALEVIRQIADKSSRAFALSALSERLPELFPEALEVTRQIEDEYSRTDVLSALCERLPEFLFSAALEVTRQIEDEASRADALSELCELLPELFSEALEVTRQIADESSRGYALLVLSKHMPELFSEALEVTRQIADESSRGYALSALCKYIPESLFSEALEVTRQIEDEYSRASALSALSERLPELFPEALEVTRQIKNDYSRASALSALCKRLPESLLSEALEITRQIENESDRASALSALSERLPELLPEALEVTRQVEDEFSRGYALRALSEHMPESLFSEALKITQQINNDYSRASALSALSERLPESLFSEALKMTRQIKDKYSRASVLSTLSEHLPELFSETLEITRQIESEYSRASVLSALSERLPELFSETLETTRQIEDESNRANVLSVLSEQLPITLLSEGLEVTDTIKDPYYCADAFARFLPRLNLESITYARWQELQLLPKLAYRRRQDFIENLPKLAPAIIQLGGKEALQDCVEAMEQVCKWWP